MFYKEAFMDLLHKIPMTWNGQTYEIRVLYEERKINVVAFQNNHPANGFRYQILLPKNCDVHGILGHDIWGELIEVSKDDIVERRWEKFAEIIQEHRTGI
jgi:hypothetical protein